MDRRLFLRCGQVSKTIKYLDNERDMYKYEQLYVKFKFNGKYYPICDN